MAGLRLPGTRSEPTCPVGDNLSVVRGELMGGRQKWVRCRGQWSSARLAVLGLVCLAGLARTVHAQQRREHEPNSVYAQRRAKLAAQVDAPIILWGFTAREEVSQAYIFAQEENFYYLTGHNEEGAGLILL